jgi:hypothetical protein
MSRRGWLIAGGVLTVLALGMVPQRTNYDGSADLEVVVQPQSGVALRAVSVETMTPQAAVSAVADCTPSELEDGRWGRVQRPFTGEPIRLAVPQGVVTDTALLWRRSRVWQHETLVVVWWPASGPRQAKAVGLPYLRTMRTMVVDIP